MQDFNIRTATNEDADIIFKMSNEFLNNSPYRSSCSEEYLSNSVAIALSSPYHEFFIAEVDDQIVGFLAAIYNNAHPLIEKGIASELAWWVDPVYRSSGVGKTLIKSFEDWAKEKNCTFVSMSYLHNYDDLSDHYTEAGYEKYEVTYIKRM